MHKTYIVANMQGLICASTVLSCTAYRHLFWRRYAILAVLVVTMVVCCAACLADFTKMSKNTKLLRTRCVSQAQNAPKVVFSPGFGRGSVPRPLRELSTLSRRPSRLGRRLHLPHYPHDAFGVSIFGASSDNTTTSFSTN